eukprot:TRINITY_DN87_c0_g1_i5.p1 TRINITY_DN87_c0_g1~~TRINITY_DN87_c0_g1_i5.p1  ORF type:complete len:148 (-),score=32.85 TRINITY_DN87_c0_g1_i5:3-446(-)
MNITISDTILEINKPASRPGRKEHEENGCIDRKYIISRCLFKSSITEASIYTQDKAVSPPSHDMHRDLFGVFRVVCTKVLQYSPDKFEASRISSNHKALRQKPPLPHRTSNYGALVPVCTIESDKATKKKKYRLRGRSSETAKAHRG